MQRCAPEQRASKCDGKCHGCSKHRPIRSTRPLAREQSVHAGHCCWTTNALNLRCRRARAAVFAKQQLYELNNFRTDVGVERPE